MSRIVGKLGSLYLDDLAGGTLVKIADIFNWSVDFNLDWDECGAKGTKVEEYSAGVFTGVVRAERFLTDTNPTDSVLAQKTLTLVNTYVGGATSGAQISYALWNINNSTGANVITGTGVIRSARMTNPRGMAGENIEIMMNSIPMVA